MKLQSLTPSEQAHVLSKIKEDKSENKSEQRSNEQRSKRQRHQIFATSLSPDQRSYVQTYIQHQIDTLISPLITEAKTLTAQNKSLTEQIQTLTDRINRYEERFKDDLRYTLTRGKVVQLLKELNIP